MKSTATAAPVRKTRFTDATISLFERTIPDPFVLAILITAVVAALSAMFAPHATLNTLVVGWYKGFFNILTFAFQITLVLVTGHAFAHAAPVQRVFKALVGIARTPVQAAAPPREAAPSPRTSARTCCTPITRAWCIRTRRCTCPRHAAGACTRARARRCCRTPRWWRTNRP